MILLQKLAKIWRKENGKSKTMTRLFLIFGIRSNIFRDFSGCRRSILNFEMVIRFVFPVAFQCRIPSYSTAKTGEDMTKRKRKTMVRLFFIFWICSNIFRNFSGCRRPIFKCFDIIRFVFPLAFQCHIPNCSTTKTREATAKRKRKVENDVSAFLHFLDSFKPLSRFLGREAFDFNFWKDH